MSAMDRHLPMDRDYTNEGGLVTLSTSDPVHHDMFVAYLSANPLSPLRIDIADRHLYRGMFFAILKPRLIIEFYFK